MSDRLAVHVGSLRVSSGNAPWPHVDGELTYQEIDFEASSEKEAPHTYAEMLVKETATLHKVLSKYLATSTVEQVMSEVLAAIVHRLTEEYGKIELKSDESKKRSVFFSLLLFDAKAAHR
jgi:vacuolar protein sorting-associated protein 54